MAKCPYRKLYDKFEKYEQVLSDSIGNSKGIRYYCLCFTFKKEIKGEEAIYSEQ